MREDAARAAKYHDVEDVEKVVLALSDQEHLRLDKIACLRARVLGSHLHQTSRDLLQEAVTRTLDGRRRWRKGVDFLYHLDQTMKSIADSWQACQQASRLSDEAEATVASPERDFEPGQEWLVRGEPGPAVALSRKEGIRLVRAAFSDDDEASQVIEGWAMDLTGPEIQEISGMSKKAYQAAVRRIRYQLPRLEIDRGA